MSAPATSPEQRKHATREQLQQVKQCLMVSVISQPGSPAPMEKVHTVDILGVERGVARVRLGGMTVKKKFHELRLLDADIERLAQEKRAKDGRRKENREKRTAREEAREEEEFERLEANDPDDAPYLQLVRDEDREPPKDDFGVWVEMGRETAVATRNRLGDLARRRIELMKTLEQTKAELEENDEEATNLQNQLNLMTSAIALIERRK